MVYNIQLKKGTSTYTLVGTQFSYGSSSKDKFKDLPSTTTLFVPLGKRSRKITAEFVFEGVTEYNNFVSVLKDWYTNAYDFYLYADDGVTLVELGVSTPQISCVLESHKLTINGKVYKVAVSAVEV